MFFSSMVEEINLVRLWSVLWANKVKITLSECFKTPRVSLTGNSGAESIIITS